MGMESDPLFVGLLSKVSPKGVRLSKHQAAIVRHLRRVEHDHKVYHPSFWGKFCLQEEVLNSFVVLGNVHDEGHRSWVQFMREVHVVLNTTSEPVSEWSERVKTLVVGTTVRTYADVVDGRVESGSIYDKVCSMVKTLLSYLPSFHIRFHADLNDLLAPSLEDFSLKSVIDSIMLRLDTGLGALSSFMKDTSSLLAKIVVIYGMYCVFSLYPSAWATIAPLMGLVWISIFPPHILDSLKAHLPKFFGVSEPTVEAGFWSPVFLIGAIVCSFLNVSKELWSNDVVQKLNTVRKIPRMANDLEDLMTQSWDTLTKAVNILLPIFGFPRLCGQISDHVEYHLNVLTLRQGLEDRTLKANSSTVKEFRELINKGRMLLRVNSTNREARSAIYASLNSLMALAKHLSPAFENAVNSRPEPVALCLIGTSGIGKSRLTHDLHVRACCHSFDDETAKACNYNFKHEMYVPGRSDYDEGYTGQFTWMEDDFGQRLEAPYDPNSAFMKMVEFVNSVPAAMNMAFETKGTVFFDSKLIMLTSNVRSGFNKYAAKVLVEPKCLDRRIITYRVTLKENISMPCENNSSIKVIDTELAKRELRHKIVRGEVAVPNNYWEFTPVSFCSGDVIGPSISYAELIDIVKHKLDANKNDNNEMEESLVRLAHALKGVEYVPLGATEPEPIPSLIQRTIEMLKKLPDLMKKAPASSWQWAKSFASNSSRELVDAYREYSYSLNVLGIQYFGLLGKYGSLFSLCATIFLFGGVVSLMWKSVAMMIAGTCRLYTKFFEKPVATIRREGISKSAVIMRNKILSMFKDKDFEVDANGNPTGITKEALLKLANVEDGEPEAFCTKAEPGVLSENVHAIWHKLKKNIVTFVVRLTDGSHAVLGNGIMLANYVCLYPYHFDYVLARFENVKCLEIRRLYKDGNKDRIACVFDDCPAFFRRTCKQDLSCEVTVRDFPCAGFPLITSYFPYRDMLPPTNGNSVALQVITSRMSEDGTDTTFMAVKGRRDGTLRLEKDQATERYVTSVIKYSSHLKCGDCGSVVLRVDAHPTAPLLGFHIAGDGVDDTPSKSGWACILDRQFLEEMVKDVAPQKACVQGFNYSLIAEECENAPIDDESFEAVGTLKEGASFIPPETKKLPTLIQEEQLFGPPTRVPAILNPNHETQPMKQAISKYKGVVRGLPVDSLRKAKNRVFSKFFENTQDLRENVILRTNEEAVTGVTREGVRLLPGLNRSSSPGFPFNIGKGKGGGMATKKTIFGPFDFDFTSEAAKAVFAEVDQVIEKALKGERSMCVFTDFLKDELRPTEKALAGKTRLISGGPMVYTIACRRLFMDFIHAFTRERIGNSDNRFRSLVGINPYSEYDGLARHVRGVGNKFIAGDFSSYDGSEQPDIHHLLFDAICDWYGNKDGMNIARRVLLMELTNSFHLGGLKNNRRTLYAWLKSLPSGHPLTCIINTMYNMVVFDWAFEELCPGMDFHTHVRAAYFGDDNLHGISDAVCERFNQLTLTPKLLELGLTYTDESKSNSTEPYLSFEEVGILKRKFRVESFEGVNRYVAPLNMTSILEAMYWWKKREGVDEKTFLSDQLNIFLREMSLHGWIVWQEYVPKTIEAMSRLYGYEPLEDYGSYRVYQMVLRETMSLKEQMF